MVLVFSRENNPIQKLTSWFFKSYGVFLRGRKTSHAQPQDSETPALHPDKTGLKLNGSVKRYQQNMTHVREKEKASYPWLDGLL